MTRFNPPPNWPAPPPGWAPTPDWRPDPAWGPPPTGWQLWTPEPGDGRRANGTAFAKVGVVAGAIVVAVALAQVSMGVFTARNLGFALGSALFPWLVVSLIVFFSRIRWNWFAIVGAYAGVWLILNFLRVAGQLAGTA